MEYPQIDSLEKEIDFLSYQEKYTYLRILNYEEELNDIIGRLKDSNNFFLNLINIEDIDILRLVKLNHSFIYKKLKLNNSKELKKKVFIKNIQIIIKINDNFPYYFKYLDLDKFSFDEIRLFFKDFFWNRNSIIEIIKSRDIFYLEYMDLDYIGDNELETLFIQTDKIIQDSWIEKILLWSDEYNINLPKEKEELLSLTKLIAMDTNIKYIPKEIGNLYNLKDINLSNINISMFDDNVIDNIPSEIYNLYNLTKLNISGNKITNIPSGISKLTNLIELNISNNNLKDFPIEIYNLSNLTKLNISGNNIEEIPTGISKLANLEVLYINNNDIKYLPKEIGNLTNLKELYISKNKLNSSSNNLFSKSQINIPKEFTNLKSLTLLDDKKDYRKHDENLSNFFTRKNYKLI